MKHLLKYIAIAGVALAAASCEREPLTSNTDEGGVNLAFDLSSVSRAVNAGDFTPEQLKVRIYRPEGADSALIRRYTAFEEIPTPLYLVAGAYSVKVEAGDKNNVAFVEEDETARRQKLCYEGWKPFSVARQTTSTIEVSCPTINVRANLVFDTSDSGLDTSYGQERPKYENRLISDVKITLAAITTTAQNVAELKEAIAREEAPTLTFEAFETTNSASGYFLMPEGVTTLVWAFEGEHETDGAIARMGTIRDVEAAHAYKVAFHYTRTPDGYAKVEVEVDDSVEVLDDKWYFKPQPEISGAGIDAAGVNRYAEGSTVTLVCEAINDLTTLSLGGVNFFENGAPVADAIAGVSCVKNEPTKVTITLAPTYFNTLNGGEQTLEFGMQDAGGSDIYAQQIKFRKQGMLPEATTADLWKNTASFEALVDGDATNVKFQYREHGASEWNTVAATQQGTEEGFKRFKATTTASWTEVVFPAEQQKANAFKPDYAKNIYANHTYEYQLLINDQVVGSVGTLHNAVSQPIADGNFESGSLPCWSEDASQSPFWGSGNNSLSATLCEQATYTGSVGKCAHLIARDPMGLLASGNLFTGTFTFGDPSFGLGTVRFGVKYPWKARPRALKFKYWASIGTVNTAKHKTVIPTGSADQGAIYVCIINWTKQHGVVSGTSRCEGVWSPESGQFPTDSEGDQVGEIIGYQTFYPQGEMSGGMVEKELELVFYDTEKMPADGNYSLIIACATSRYGDYMNGCNSNQMYIDEFEWVY